MAKHISVTGVAQGAGFAPFVYGLATQLNLHGWVSSLPDRAEIVVQGQLSNIEQFMSRLRTEAPSLAKIVDITVSEETCSVEYSTFEIRASVGAQGTDPVISADVAICPDCERELFNPRNRRYLYPFISCKNCGPRFSIIKDTPYNRLNTTMDYFAMCDACGAEYKDPLDRRFQAHLTDCPDCGPFVELRETHSLFPPSDPQISSIEIRTSAILKARRLLREGYIVAIKGVGGFHLACDASNPYTVAELRDRKGRIDKPFAVMAANLTVIATVCHMSKEEQLLLASPEKPIVLLTRKQQTGWQTYKVSELVAPNLDTLGVMLPHTPLHHLLLNQTDPVLTREPVPPVLVMTSSNFSEEPIAIDNKDALERLSPLADAFVLHNRDIYMRSDDSVVKVDKNDTIYLRRARGYAPYPLELPFDVKPTLGVGGELKNTFCLAHGRSAFLSHHVGDMENAETLESFEHGIQHLSHLFDVEPEVIARDLHPDYFTTQYANHVAFDRQPICVQHHHAHIASCMADNGLEDRRLIGLCFDEAGYGVDEAIWGGEVLLASYTDFERFAHLQYLPVPGGDSATRVPWRVAVAYAHALGIRIDDLAFLQNLDKQAVRMVRQQIDKNLNSPLTSSVGYLFDAVASLIGIHNEVTYEGQAAMEMIVLAKPFISLAKPYPYALHEAEGEIIVSLKELLSSIVEDVRTAESVGVIAARFHKTISSIALDICKFARSKTGLNEVALSGDMWQNQILLDLIREGLRQEEFIVYFHKQVPTNDGGLALGQAVVANFRARNIEDCHEPEELVKH